MIDIGFCPLQLGALNSDTVTRRLKIFFAGAKQRRVGRLQQAQNVLGKEQHSHVQGRNSNGFREIFTYLSSFAWFGCIGTPWKIRIFSENQWLEDVFSH